MYVGKKVRGFLAWLIPAVLFFAAIGWYFDRNQDTGFIQWDSFLWRVIVGTIIFYFIWFYIIKRYWIKG